MSSPSRKSSARSTRSPRRNQTLTPTTKKSTMKTPKKSAKADKAGTPKKSAKSAKHAKKQNQKVTRTCLSQEAKKQKIELILADRQRIIDNKTDEDHSINALCKKHNLPRSVYFRERDTCVSCHDLFGSQSDAIKCSRNDCVGKICHKCLACMFVSNVGSTMALMKVHFITCPVCRFTKAFVVEDAENGEDYLTNPAFKRPIFFKHIRQVISDGIPMVQKYLNDILKDLCSCRKSLEYLLKSANIGRLDAIEGKAVKQFVAFCGKNIGSQSYSSSYSGKMTELRRAMEFLGEATGESFITEIQKLNPIGHTFEGARSLMLDVAVRVYQTVEQRSSPAAPSSAYSFAQGLSSLYLAVHPPHRTIDLTDDVGASETAGDGHGDANVTGENAEEAPVGNAGDGHGDANVTGENAEEAPVGNAAEEADAIAAAGEAGVEAGAIEDGSNVRGGGVVNEPEEIIVNNTVGGDVAGEVEAEASHDSSFFSDESSSGSY